MNVKLLIPTVLFALCAGCSGGSGGGETPEECYEAIRQALRDKDTAAFYYAHAPELRTEILLDEQLCAEGRARSKKKLEDYKKIKADYGVGEWTREYGTLIKDQIYEEISESNRAKLYGEFIGLLQTKPPRGAEKFGELQGKFTVSGDAAIGVAITYPEPYRMPENFEELDSDTQDVIRRGMEQYRDDNAGKHLEHEVKLVKRDGAWFFLEFGSTKTIVEDE